MAQIAAGAGASNSIYEHQQPKEQHRSKFDLSRITNLTADSGMIIPFDFFETLPNDSFNLSAEVALETLPTITNVLTPYHVRTHWYYMRNSDIWKGWNTFITKGRTGNIELEIPKVQPNGGWETKYKDGNTTRTGMAGGVTTHSLAAYLGLIPGYNPTLKTKPYIIDQEGDYTDLYEADTTANAMPFFMYQAICKYNYVNQNLLQDNKALFPDEGDSDWRIPYDWKANTNGTNTLTTIDGHPSEIVPYELKDDNDEYIANINGIYNNNDNVVLLSCLRYAPFEDDYFTTALPWQQRGTEQTLETDLDLSNLQITSTPTANATANLNIGYRTTDGEGQITKTGYVGAGTSGTIKDINDSSQITNGSELYAILTGDDAARTININSTLQNPLIEAGTTITANQLREMIAMSVWQERNARVNGSYNSMIWIHFEHNPKTEDHYPIFIGGTSSYINFGEVTQTSASTNDSPQGNITSKGTMYETQDIGHFECPDYGYIMGIMIISPTTTYNTTIPRELICENVMEDYYFPEFEQLGMQPILNKELKLIGNNSKDNDLWGYQERYSYLKTRQNVNRGLFRLKSETDTLFSAATQSREFAGTEAPKLSYQFVTQSPENTRRDWLAYENEPMFKVQIASKVMATRNMSYASRPNNFGF